MLTAISRALGLGEAERSYLHLLAGEPVPAPNRINCDVQPGVLRLLDRLDDTPALVCSAIYDVLAWNTMASALLGDIGARTPAERNVVRRFFTNAQARANHDDVGARRFADESVADLRAAAARYPDDPTVLELIADLQLRSPEFGELWERRDVSTERSMTKRLYHPVVGWLELECQAPHDPGRDQWIILYSAAPGTADHEALKLLRVVGTQQLAADAR